MGIIFLKFRRTTGIMKYQSLGECNLHKAYLKVTFGKVITLIGDIFFTCPNLSSCTELETEINK